ncbi:3-dehydroquinate synthase [Deinococcus pimensis]|uniref:3-dehydroquinate synthase n=1 Tax=Deinococcus pimensis TaxID=309888 RepID=UPI000485176F|nr:3-dehydroquinate synthase [Deinococcus pimensis]
MANRSIQQTVTVTFRYPVEFTTGLFHSSNLTFRDALDAAHDRAKFVVVVDDGVARAHTTLLADVEAYARAHASALDLAAPPLVLPGGEAVKHDPAFVTQVQDLVEARGIDRHSYVVAIGGGALLDMVGYAAATAHRGVRLVRVPTTVLSQNDSAVGVKNSVNAYGKKNWLGTFAPPAAVLCDLDFLTTLHDRDWRGGLTEAVKVAVLRDPAFLDFLEANAAALRGRDARAMEHAVVRCAELHLEHIATSGDAFELGSARPLDFGHWAAHKLEAMTDYELRHGEAVGIGIALDTTYAWLAGMLPEADWRRVLGVIAGFGLDLTHPLLTTRTGEVLAGLNEFREHLGGRLTITLPRGVGRPVEVHEMDLDLLARAADTLNRIHAEGEDAWRPTPEPAR